MRIVYEYSHLGGAEILQVRYPDCEREVYEIIADVTAKRTKISEEKTMRGRELYSPKDMNQHFARHLGPGDILNCVIHTRSPCLTAM